MKWSKYQNRIFEEYNNTNRHISIQAVAGAGKTSTVLHLAKLTPQYKKIVFLAFNKSISEEIKKKAPSNVEVATVHSMAYRMLRYNHPKKYRVNEIKSWVIAKEKLRLSEFLKKDSKKMNAYLFILSRIVDLYRMNDCVNIEDMVRVVEQYNVPILSNEINDSMELINHLKTYNTSSYHKDFMIDFTDMIWLLKELVDTSKYLKYDVVIIDEAQDINSLQRWFVQSICKKNGRIVSVGDFSQSIYSFQGASKDNFKILQNLPNTTKLPLSVCYRCGKNIVKEAQKVFNHIEYFDKSEDGIVRDGYLNEVREGDMVICRNNLPLIESWLELIKMNKKAIIWGKDYGKGLTRICQKIVDLNNDQVEEYFSSIVEEKIKDKKGNTKHQSVIELRERISILKILKNKFKTFNGVLDILDGMFDESKSRDAVVMSTIHKAKGSERDRVFFLYPELIPSEYAETEMEKYGEKCILYVGITRAIKELVYIRMKKIGSQISIDNLNLL
jgi:superfamily I DNA/RNA helicase